MVPYCLLFLYPTSLSPNYFTFVNNLSKCIRKLLTILSNALKSAGRRLKKAPNTATLGDYILRIGEYCRFIGFLNKGFIVATTDDDTGNEKASEFKLEGCFLGRAILKTRLLTKILLLLKIAKRLY